MKNGMERRKSQETAMKRSLSSIPKECWETRSKLEKKLIIVTLATSTLLLLIILLYVIFSSTPEVCTSSTCVRTAMDLLNHIDLKADPCDDFYRFTCGNFLKNTKLDHQASRSVLDNMEEEVQTQIRSLLEKSIKNPMVSGDPTKSEAAGFNLAKKFYRACMNESAVEVAGLKRIKEIFKQIGGWPTLDGHRWRENEFDWKYAIHTLRKVGINFEFFLILAVEKDDVNPSKYILTIRDPFYSPSEISNEQKSLYLEYMEDIAVLFGSDRRIARRDQSEVLDFILKLAKISEESQQATERSNVTLNTYTLSELQYKYGSIPWFEYINGILNPATRITYDDFIYVSEPDYLRKVEILLRYSKSRVLANFIAWHTIQHLINYLPARILDRAYDYLNKINGKVIRKPRWKSCVTATEERLNSAIAAEYVKEYFNDDIRLRVIDMIRNLKIQFKFTLRKLTWMDRQTKQLALEKLHSSMEDIVSHTALFEINEENNDVYNEVEVYEEELLRTVLNLDFVNTNIKFARLREGVKDNWLKRRDFLTGLNIIYLPKENVLRFPIGILRGIYFNKERPEYMNYGALGTVIGHEISHIFIEAEYRELQGTLRSWWSPQTLLNYEEKLQCLTKQYDAFVIPELGKHLNGTNTRNEDLADLAGMKVSYDAYINLVHESGAEARLPGLNYSPNQLFWISSAIRHCSKDSTETLERYIANYEQSPGRFRVNGPLRNIDEFAYDFGCSAGTKMNPQNKCTIW